jgi:hypothetical protein
MVGQMEELDGFFGQVLDDFLKAAKDKEAGAYVPGTTFNSLDHAAGLD